MTTIHPDRLADITRLASGRHATPNDGMCFMEAVAYVAGEAHTDHPACVAPVLGAMGRGLNDVLPDELRQQLIPLILDLPGTAGDGHDEVRSYLALDWLIRTWLPAWLDLEPACREDAARIRELGRIVDLVSAERAGPLVHTARQRALAAWSAAGSAARNAAGSAAASAARNAAWSAAESAAESAAGSAAGSAARNAAWSALAPTVAELQHSAIDLYRRMTLVGRDVA